MPSLQRKAALYTILTGDSLDLNANPPRGGSHIHAYLLDLLVGYLGKDTVLGGSGYCDDSEYRAPEYRPLLVPNREAARSRVTTFVTLFAAEWEKNFPEYCELKLQDQQGDIEYVRDMTAALEGFLNGSQPDRVQDVANTSFESSTRRHYRRVGIFDLGQLQLDYFEEMVHSFKIPVCQNSELPELKRQTEEKGVLMRQLYERYKQISPADKLRSKFKRELPTDLLNHSCSDAHIEMRVALHLINEIYEEARRSGGLSGRSAPGSRRDEARILKIKNGYLKRFQSVVNLCGSSGKLPYTIQQFSQKCNDYVIGVRPYQ